MIAAKTTKEERSDSFPSSKNPDTVAEDAGGNTDDTMCGGGLAAPVDPAIKRRPEVVKNKYTNSLIWTCYLESRDKQELRLEYVVEYPQGMSIQESSTMRHFFAQVCV